MTHRDLSIGTHNLHDLAGRPTFFADVLFFTEAIAPRIRTRAARLRGWDLLVCAQQPDLAIAYRRRVFEPVAGAFRLAHEGIARVTPHRGTFVVSGLLLGRPADLVVEHRINAAFPPYVRGEAEVRPELWHAHTDLTNSWIAELTAARRLVLAGGDLNTPRGVRGYRGQLREVGRGLDRLGVSRPLDLDRPVYLGRAGSDHPRVRATVKGAIGG